MLMSSIVCSLLGTGYNYNLVSACSLARTIACTTLASLVLSSTPLAALVIAVLAVLAVLFTAVLVIVLNVCHVILIT